MTSGGREVDVGGRDPTAKTMHCLSALLQVWTPDVSMIETTQPVRNLLSSLVRTYLTFPLRPPHIHSHDECSLAFHIFCRSSAPVYYRRGRPGNEASLLLTW